MLISYLQSHDDSIQVQYWFPVLPQNVQAHLAFQVDIRMVNLFHASYFWGLVGEILVDGEIESEPRPSVHALVWLDT